MKDLQEIYEKETKREVLTPDDYGGYYFTYEYVEWLEERLLTKEQK